ncbi:MAG: septum formation protein Maf [Bacteroidota bacterium]|jgi:septum formation protein
MKLILGSKSPRRKELLSSIGFNFEIRTKETDESFPTSLNPSEVALYIANKKAQDLISDLKEDEVVLCADTVVIIDDTILGKPSNQNEASQMLKLLSGRAHLVITGVVISSLEKNIQFQSSTIVSFLPLTIDEIQMYIEQYKPYDKAGSYGIQEWIGAAAIQKIEGSYNNVVGLPTHEVYQALKKFQ